MTSILDSFKAARASVKSVLNQWGYEVNSSGTKDLNLPSSALLENNSGYWDLTANSGITNKPPRWIVHLKLSNGSLVTDLAKDPTGQELRGASSVGYINNRMGKAAVLMFRLMPALEDSSSGFSFPPDWEWIVTFAFEHPLPPGTSGELISNFDPHQSTLNYKGNQNQQSQPYNVPVIGLIKSDSSAISSVQIGSNTVTYDDATRSLYDFLNLGSAQVKICDPGTPADLNDLAKTIESQIKKTSTQDSVSSIHISPASNLIGISDSIYSRINASFKAGKKHLILYGPPGTGKTTLAEHIAEQIADEDNTYIELTASSSWSSQDLVGGYQPIGNGNIAFIPGIMLKNFEKPIVIDEMNRCPIDKVIGPLFSVLSGQPTTLPYRTDVSNPDSESYKILPSPVTDKAENEFAPGPRWSMICTLNQVDKTQLGQLSYALSRRFAWIRVGVPENLKHFTVDIFERLGYIEGSKDYSLPNPIADMWEAVNKIRELGGAPIIDFAKLAKGLKPDLDLLTDPAGDNVMQKILIDCLTVTVTPLLDGIRASDAQELSESLTSSWSLDDSLKKVLTICVMELAV